MMKRYWHIGICALAGAGIFGIVDFVYLKNIGALPSLKELWWLSILVPMLCGVLVTLGCGGATLKERFTGSFVCGALIALLYTALSIWIGHSAAIELSDIATKCLWRIFIFSIFSIIGAIVTELKLPDPDLA
jgi:hypothetical protein